MHRPLLHIASHRSWIAAGVLAAGFWAAPAGACSMVKSQLHGALAADGSVVFAVAEGDDAHPGALRLFHYSRTGVASGELFLDFDLADAYIVPRGLDGAGNVWLAVRCWGDPQDELCNALLQLAPNGDLLRRLALPEGEWPRFDPASGGFLAGGVESRVLTVRPYPPPAKPEPRRFPLPHDVAKGNTAWGFAEDGTAIFAVTANYELDVLVFDPGGELRTRVSYPAARSGRAFEETEEVRLGPPWVMTAAADGTLFIAQYGLASDCEVYQPSSVAILDPGGALVAVAPADETISSLRVVDDELVVLQTDGKVLRLTHDGTRIEAWNPGIGHWRVDAETRQSLVERAAAVDRGAGADVWLELYPYSRSEQREQINAWLVEAGPAALEAADDEHWRKLGQHLCERHPDAAAAEALRRFARSRGTSKASWLEMLVVCFPEAPPEAYEYALGIAGRDALDYEKAAAAAFEAWGYSPAMLEVLWRKALDPAGEQRRARRLLRVFDQTAAEFDRRLRGGPEAERRTVRQILLESIRLASPDAWVEAPERIADVRPGVIAAAGEWAAARDAFTAATGRLLLVGHRLVPAAELMPALLADAAADASLRPWLGWVLGQVVRDRQACADLPVAELAQRALEQPVPLDVDLLTEFSALYDPYRWLFEICGAAATDRLLAGALAPRGSLAIRRQLLDHLGRMPWALEEPEIGQVLDQPWLGNERLLQETVTFFTRLDRLLAGLETPLHDRARTRFCKVLPRFVDRRPELLDRLAWQLADTTLLRALSAAAAARLVDAAPGGLQKRMWVVAGVGAWPEIEAEVAALLDDGAGGFVSAAIALAPRRDPRALDVLTRGGLRYHQAPTSAFAHYGDEALRRLEPLAFHQDYEVRTAARRVLRSLEPGVELVERLASEVSEALADDEIPGVDAVLILDRAGRDVMPGLLRVAAALGDEQRYRFHDYDHPDFAEALTRWAAGDSARRAAARPLLDQLTDLAGHEAQAWRRRHAATAAPAGEDPVPGAS